MTAYLTKASHGKSRHGAEQIEIMRKTPAVIKSLADSDKLVWRMIRREIAGRYRGSILGFGWALLVPLLMLSVFTFVFSVVFQVRWDAEIEGRGQFALLLFAGLIVYQYFAECLSRAPNLMLDNVSYIKKVVFPLESLAWVVAGTAGFTFAMNTVMLLAGHFLLAGPPPLTALLLPVVIIPFILGVAGVVWVISAAGVFLRDLQQVVSIVTTLAMFLSPIFYPIDAVPERFQVFLMLNPLAYVIETVRGLLIYGQLPGLVGLVLYTIGGWLMASAGLWFFLRTRKAFADVV